MTKRQSSGTGDNWKVIEWFRQCNSRVIKALRDHLLPKKEKGRPKSVQLRQLFMTSQMTCIINGENEKIDLETYGQIGGRKDGHKGGV
jgi:hypothetical protein